MNVKLHKIVIRMSKLAIYAIVISQSFLMAMANESNAQGKYLKEIYVNLDFEGSTIDLKDLIEKVEASSKFNFAYSKRDIKSKEINVHSGEWNLMKLLNEVSLQGEFSIRRVNETISLMTVEKSRFPQVVEQVPFQHSVTGTITDEEGEPLPGAAVLEKGTSNGTITDVDGKFQFNTAENAVLLVSFVGYKSQEVPLNGQSSIEILMEVDVSSLDEVVVVGYGTVRKSDLTGAVASVNEKGLMAFPSVNVLQTMQGRAAGVVIQSTNGEPGGQFKIRVRGATSINASSDPLFVVDGLVGGALPPADDIKSIEVLKDASASAIYGSRGANGVVMITTKSGTVGKTEVKVNSFYSFQKEIGRLEVLNAQQFAEYINDARGTEFFDINNVTTNTDWQDLVFQQGHTQNHQISVSGGNEKAQYYVSGVLYDQKGVIKRSSFDRYSLTTNIKFSPVKRLRISLNTFLQGLNSGGIISQGGAGPTNLGVVNSAQRFDPNQGIIDENGNYTQSVVGIAAFDNPMAIINGREEQNRNENIQVNAKAAFDIIEGLTFNSTFGTIVRNGRNGEYNSKIITLGITNDGIGWLNYRRNFNFLTEQYLNYHFKLADKNEFNITGGYSYQVFKNENFSASNAGFITDALSYWNLGVGTNPGIPSSNYSESKIASFYGRLNYNFDDRYLITFTGRYDGASQFSEGNQWSFFPSGALSWNLHNEGFWPEIVILSTSKIRTSYGLTGNQAIGPYQSLAGLSKSFFVSNEVLVNSVRPTSIANSDLTWETTSQFNIGLDLGLFEDRLLLTGEYYRKETNDLLFNVPIPAFSGYQNRLDNLGAIENKGFELQLEARALVNEFQWTTSLNLTLNKNKVLSLPEGKDIFYSAAPSNVGGEMETSILRVDQPVGSFYGYVYEGVYQEGDTFIPGGGFEQSAGGEKFRDIDGRIDGELTGVPDGMLNADDRQIIGNPNPKAVWGFNNDVSFKGFYLNLFFQAFTGGDMLNLVKLDMDRLSGNTNATTDALRRWTPENTDTDVPRAAGGRSSRVSTRFVEDGSFLRLKNISIGYDFSPSWLSAIKIKSARVYVSGQNLFTLTNYSGVDPEVGYRSDNVRIGLDYDSYPNTKAYTIGINLGF